MQFLKSVLFSFVLLSACSEISRQPELPISELNLNSEKVSYSVNSYDATPDTIARANKAKFERFLISSSKSRGSAIRVEERQVFNGYRAPFNEKPQYKIHKGDILTIIKYGHSTSANGIISSQRLTENVVVDDAGTIDIGDGNRLSVVGLTLPVAKLEISNRYNEQLVANANVPDKDAFPADPPEAYLLRVGDAITVSRILIDSEGKSTTLVSTHSVGSDGLVNILEVGDVDVVGKTLPEVRTSVQDTVTRKALGPSISVELSGSSAQTANLTGSLGSRVISLTERPLSFATFLTGLGPDLSGQKDYKVVLNRQGQVFESSINTLLNQNDSLQPFVHDGDRIKIEELLPELNVDVEVKESHAAPITFVNVPAGFINLSSNQRSRAIPFDVSGIDLRQLLVSQSISVNRTNDVLVRVVRGSQEYKLSAKSVVLDSPSKRLWLQPGDHVIVEELAYVSDHALLVGEIPSPSRLPVDPHSRTTLSEALFQASAFTTREADFRHIYVLRGSGSEFDAYHFDLRQVMSLPLAERFELRPRDIVFVQTRPISRYNRALTDVVRLIAGLENIRERLP